MQSKFTITIYGLVDPAAPDVIAYVGATRQALKERLDSHIRQKRSAGLKVGWIAGLSAAGRKPAIVGLAMTTLENANAVELGLILALSPALNSRIYATYSTLHVHNRSTRDFPNGTPR